MPADLRRTAAPLQLDRSSCEQVGMAAVASQRGCVDRRFHLALMRQLRQFQLRRGLGRRTAAATAACQSMTSQRMSLSTTTAAG